VMGHVVCTCCGSFCEISKRFIFMLVISWKPYLSSESAACR